MAVVGVQRQIAAQVVYAFFQCKQSGLQGADSLFGLLVAGGQPQVMAGRDKLPRVNNYAARVINALLLRQHDCRTVLVINVFGGQVVVCKCRHVVFQCVVCVAVDGISRWCTGEGLEQASKTGLIGTGEGLGGMFPSTGEGPITGLSSTGEGLRLVI